MSKKRSYNEGCPVSHAVDLVGERWALLVVRELLLGPKRFVDLRDALCGASSNILSTRLRDLAEIGVLRRYYAHGPSSGPVYELTDWGRDLQPVLFALGAWGIGSAEWNRLAPSTVDSLVLSLRANAEFLFNGGAPVSGVCQMRVSGDDRLFTLTFDDAGLGVTAAAPQEADGFVELDNRTLQRLITGDETLGEAVDAGRVKLSGDERLFESLFERAHIQIPA